MTLALLVFWFSLAVCIYVYFGYPALLWIMARCHPEPRRRRRISSDREILRFAQDDTPRLSLIIPAFNEERVIAAKIENSLAADYPTDRIEILVVSNGSSDATEEIVRRWDDPRVRLIALPQPGKMEALNTGVQQASGDVLVFTDADFLVDRGALRALARKFNDETVGGVCGARAGGLPRDGDATGEGEGLYGRWDRWQKIRESGIGSVFAADGLLYAIRKHLYVPIEDPAQADDIAISTRVVLQGYRLLFEPEATAWERSTVEAGQEFGRKVRVTNHSVRALLNLRGRLLTSGFYSVELLSHKLVRHFIPFFLISLFVTNVVVMDRSPLYVAALAGQVAIYALALAGALLRNHDAGRFRLLAVPYYFCFVNAAALLGILSIMQGTRTQAWSTRAASDRPLIRPPAA